MQLQPPTRPPSIHLRAVIIWLSIYPLVTVAQILLGPLLGGVPIPLATLLLTVLVVPVAVYLVVPLVTIVVTRISRRAGRSRRERRTRRAASPAPPCGSDRARGSSRSMPPDR